MNVSTRASVVTRRTYNRPLNEEGTVFETWEQTVDRVIEHVPGQKAVALKNVTINAIKKEILINYQK